MKMIPGKRRRKKIAQAVGALGNHHQHCGEDECGSPNAIKEDFRKQFEQYWKELPGEEQVNQAKLFDCGNCRGYADSVKREFERIKEETVAAAAAFAEENPVPIDIEVRKKEKNESRRIRHEKWEQKRNRYAKSILPNH